ncbi:AraC family transcriptional regulator [Gordonia sp. (in: high G+C Gram-positive bacteria)]|uniref:helix-turn-helix domain-containing protein n=1 Tax=Gordonia sp. (in: high G+C Gram-positive bacteria) TaxID=84139 RepID=UPI00333EA876
MSAPTQANNAENVDRALAALEWTLQESRREQLSAGEHRLYGGPTAGFRYLVDGSLEIDDCGTTRLIAAGDVILWPHGSCGRLRALTDVDMVSVVFAPTPAPSRWLHTLPTAVLIGGFRAAEPAVAGLIDTIGTGPGATRPGDVVICNRITSTIVSVVMRTWLERGCAPDLWADRLAEPDLSRVIDALHAEPGRAWTVDELARAATMSRSAFAERFRELTGRSPASYLAGVRMAEAMRLLNDGEPVAATAHRLGYESEAGFSRAFRRHTGHPPARWRRDRQAQPSAS